MNGTSTTALPNSAIPQTSGYVQTIPPYHAGGMCPNCGYCPHCGRGYTYIYPSWPYQPSITYGMGAASANGL